MSNQPPEAQRYSTVADQIVGAAAPICLQVDTLSWTDPEICSRLLSAIELDRLTPVILTVSHSAEQYITKITEHLDSPPEQVYIVDTSSTTANKTHSEWEINSAVDVITVADAGNVVQLGIRVNEQIKKISADTSPVFCGHSLSALLQHATQRTIYEFTSVLRGRLRSNGIPGYFALYTPAHDERTVNTFRPLFETVLYLG